MTAKHPFYTSDGWKDAADLEIGDQIITRNDETLEITGTKFNYEPKRVYNFKVSDWHTYFVGAGFVVSQWSDRINVYLKF